ncbi:MAG: hypothetical protein KAS12_04220 [Candidatus Aenigmarchaeota archaeon]|nr:hypothetical protein [Candidatus Aenigmarchaeota archaeon]
MIKPANRQFLDVNVNKHIQSFRIAGCNKVDSTRVKKIIHGNFTSSLISINDGNYNLDDLPEDPKPAQAQIDVQINAEIPHLVQERLGADISFDKEVNGFYYFRKSPNASVFCPICERDHDGTENFPYAFCKDGNVYLKCRRNKTNGDNKSLILGQTKQGNKGKKQKKPFAFQYSATKHSEHIKALVAKQLPQWRTQFENAKYISEFQSANTMLIRAGTGAGKTKQLIEYLKANRAKSVCYITHRITQAEDAYMRFNRPEDVHARFNQAGLDFDLYNKIEGEITSPRLVIEMESLRRIKEKYDIVVFDEIESIIGQVDSHHFTDVMSRRIFNMFLCHAPQIICLDANMNKMYDLVRIFRKKGTVWSYINTRQNKRNLHIYENTAGLTLELRDSMFCDCKVVVICDTRERADTVAEEISRCYPNKRIKFYSSKTSNETKKNDLSHVNEVWVECDVLIYTPTICTGVSFEIVNHFDEAFCYFENPSMSFDPKMQMMGRVRSLTTFYIYVQNYHSNGPQNIEEVEALLVSMKQHLNESGEGLMYSCNIYEENREFVKNPCYYSHVLNALELAKCQEDMQGGFLQYLCEHFDATIILEAAKNNEAEKIQRDLTARFKDDACTDHENAVANACIEDVKDITDQDEIRQIDDSNKREKLMLMNVYEVDKVKITPPFVATYLKKIPTFNNLRSFNRGASLLIAQYPDENSRLKNEMACDILAKLGYDGIFSDATLTSDVLKANLKNLDVLNMAEVSFMFKKQRVFKKGAKPGDCAMKYVLGFVNGTLKDLYDVEIKATEVQRIGKRVVKNNYKITKSKLFMQLVDENENTKIVVKEADV